MFMLKTRVPLSLCWGFLFQHLLTACAPEHRPEACRSPSHLSCKHSAILWTDKRPGGSVVHIYSLKTGGLGTYPLKGKAFVRV